MDILEKFLNKYSYKFEKGYPDMNNEQDILLLETILNEVMGFELKINEKFNPLGFGDINKTGREIRATKIAQKIESGEPFELVSGEQKILHFTKDDYTNLFLNKELELLKKIAGTKVNSFPFFKDDEGKQYGIGDLIKTQDFGGKGFVVGVHIEDREVETLTKQFEELGPVNIKIGDKIYKNISKIEKPRANPKADFTLFDSDGKPQIYISHKDAGGFQQYSGVSVFAKHPEVVSFVDKVKELTGGELQSKNSFQRNIEDEELKRKAMYGYENEFGVNKVQIICQGEMKLVQEGDNYIIKSQYQLIYPEVPTDKYNPKLAVTFRRGLNQQNVKNARFGIYPEQYGKSAKEI